MNDVIFVGIQQGGVVLANDIMASLQHLNPSGKIQYGQLDITFYPGRHPERDTGARYHESSFCH
ncbi:MAG: hypothetical protein IPQ06_09650 [Chitinophagaceae bacterium]|nr:hypothetical protein [Chitinophagaceae bacterium]